MALKKFLMAGIVAAVLVACGDDDSDFATHPDGDSGRFTDERDDQRYRTVKIGNQVWMAENLNYAYTGVPFNKDDNTSDSTSWCYDNDPANCTKYGRLYTWAAAMDSVGEWSTNGKGCGYKAECWPTYPVRGICPVGWHLPSDQEFVTLIEAVGTTSTAGKVLKSTSGWYNNSNGSDAYSFSALPAGEWYSDWDFVNDGIYAYFWSSSELSGYDYSACRMFLSYRGDEASRDVVGKDYGLSVRCVKDE